jgi:hypothetical protein
VPRGRAGGPRGERGDGRPPRLPHRGRRGLRVQQQPARRPRGGPHAGLPARRRGGRGAGGDSPGRARHWAPIPVEPRQETALVVCIFEPVWTAVGADRRARGRGQAATAVFALAAVPVGAKRAAFERDFKQSVAGQITAGGGARVVAADGPGRPGGRLSALRVLLWKSVLRGAPVWARRALHRQKRRFPARRAAACLVHYLLTIANRLLVPVLPH